MLALAKTDLTIANAYFRLVGDPVLEEQFATLIVGEYRRGCDAVFEMTGQSHLLDDVSWLRDSIGRRSPFVDALNLLQIDLLSRLRAAERRHGEHRGVGAPGASDHSRRRRRDADDRIIPGGRAARPR